MAVWAVEKSNIDQSADDLTWLQAALLPNVHRVSAAVRKWYWRGPLLSISEQLIGPNVKSSGSQLSFKMRGNTQNFEWHQDNQYGHLAPYTAVTTVLALDDCTAENGAICVADSSHKEGQRPAGWSPLAAADERGVVAEAVSGGKPVPMRAGQVLLLHCHTLHSSRGNFTDGNRRMLFCRYADADAVEVYLLRGRDRPNCPSNPTIYSDFGSIYETPFPSSTGTIMARCGWGDCCAERACSRRCRVTETIRDDEPKINMYLPGKQTSTQYLIYIQPQPTGQVPLEHSKRQRVCRNTWRKWRKWTTGRRSQER